jgi:predicted DCC family thiol-disulfide oxidoreductase YuxK
MSSIIVIYDGQCEFCKTCINWVKKRLEIEAIAFQDADLAKYDLTVTQCQKQVFVIEGSKKYSAAAAVLLLLEQRGNQLLANLLKGLGPITTWGYFWVANHRSSRLVRLLGKFLKILT